MAIATKKTRSELVLPKEPVIVKRPNGVVLNLNDDEARVLSILLAQVGGDPTDTARGVSQGICEALRDAGYHFNNEYGFRAGQPQRKALLSGGISFNDRLTPRDAAGKLPNEVEFDAI